MAKVPLTTKYPNIIQSTEKFLKDAYESGLPSDENPAEYIGKSRSKSDAMRSAAKKSLNKNTQKSILEEYEESPKGTNPVLFGIGAAANRAGQYLTGESDKKEEARKKAQEELDSLDSSSEEKPKYKKGGMVRGAGCASKGHGKGTMY
jgi:hypothetical protein